MSQELYLDWVKLLPLAIFRLWTCPIWLLSILHFEHIYGRPVLTLGLPSKPSPLPDHPLPYHFHSLLWNLIHHSLPWPCTNPCPSLINIRVYVFLFSQYFSPLSLKWQGPLKVILGTPTAANLEGRSLWFHLSHLKLLPLHLKMILLHTQQLQQDPARLSFRRHWDQLPCRQFRTNEVSPHNCSLLDGNPTCFPSWWLSLPIGWSTFSCFYESHPASSNSSLCLSGGFQVHLCKDGKA